MKDAPARLLDAGAWQKLIQLQGSEHAALNCLKLSPAYFDMHCDWSIPGTLECRNAIRAALAEGIGSGRIVARGIPQNAVTGPVNLDRSQVDRMKFDFLKNEIRVGDVICRDVSLARVIAVDGGTQAEIVGWLQKHRTGRAGKEWLRHQAILELGSRVTQRGFNAAYSEVFRRARGHPRKNDQSVD